MNKKILNKIEVTDAQRSAIDAAVVALGEICEAYEKANGERPGFEIQLKAERKTDMSGAYPWPRRTRGWWKCGDILTNEGYGPKLEDALAMHFAATDATLKRKSAARCRSQADLLEREAKELETQAAGSA